MTHADISILVVDDDIVNLQILEDTLGDAYTVRTAGDGLQALAYFASGGRAELILTDIVMPLMDGYELCCRLKADPLTRDIPVLFLSSLDSANDEEKGLNLGAEDFIHKPISPPVVLARVKNHLELAQARARLRERNAELEQLVIERTRELMRREQEVSNAQSATITAFCALAEARDNETGHHIRRTQHYVKILAEHLRGQLRFSDKLNDDTIMLLFKSAPLHDIGKVAIPDAILNKPGKLTPEEWVVMRRHAEFGHNAITQAELELSQVETGFLRYASEIAYCHHEKWDGSGYPRGLSGEEIPLSARLMAVADVYDALISKRVYKSSFSHAHAVETICEGRGSHFDPDIVDAFVVCADEFLLIASRFSDQQESCESLKQDVAV
jgi:putative two-component system response regulator